MNAESLREAQERAEAHISAFYSNVDKTHKLDEIVCLSKIIVELIAYATALRNRTCEHCLPMPAPVIPAPSEPPAIERIRLALVATHNLTATDRPNAYEDAQRDGDDASGARDVQRECSWIIDHTEEIALCDELLASRPIPEPVSEEDVVEALLKYHGVGGLKMNPLLSQMRLVLETYEASRARRGAP